MKIIGKKTKILLTIFFIFALCISLISSVNAVDTTEIKGYVNLSNLTYNSSEIKIYKLEEIDQFIEDFNSGNLPEIYITEFMYDGVGAVQKIDLDDETNEVEKETVETTVINVNTTGNIEFTGTIEKAMIAVNTNNVIGEINLILNNVNITSKNSTSAIIVYNKDVTYTECKVTIVAKEGTKNYITGGRLKKVSLMDKDSLTEDYVSNSEYYGIYTASEIDKILFASEKADQEKIAEGDPLYYYKYSGVIGSDIELNFEGTGYLEITSTKNEGIETKGNLNFLGGIGDYKITAYDDCLNASTSGTDIKIDVNSLIADVQPDPDLDEGEQAEGDAIDSNGTIHIEGGKIYAFASATSGDAGLDSDKGTYINGGTVITTGNMGDSISTESKQKFIQATLSSRQVADTLMCITKIDGTPIMAFEGDRTYSNFVYSSSTVDDSEYTVYSGGEIKGTKTNGLYDEITSYTPGTKQQTTSNEMEFRQMGDHMQMNNPDSASTNIIKIIMFAVLVIIVIVVAVLVIYLLEKRKTK